MAKEKKRSRRERRLSARRLKSISPYQALTPFIMPTRNDALVSFSDTIDITETEKFIHEQRAGGMKGLGMLHVFVAGFIRAVSRCPQLNRFICGQRIYSRDNVEVVMTVKREMKVESDETSIKLAFSPDSTLIDVYDRMKDAIEEVKEGTANDTDRLASWFMSLPRGFLRFVMWILRIFDYHGWIPGSLLAASPFHGSLILTDVGSLGIPPVAHHIYNFGNLSVFIAFGTKYRKFVTDAKGGTERHCFIDYRVVIDERICDGSAFALGASVMKQSIKKPGTLMEPPKEVVSDIP